MRSVRGWWSNCLWCPQRLKAKVSSSSLSHSFILCPIPQRNKKQKKKPIPPPLPPRRRRWKNLFSFFFLYFIYFFGAGQPPRKMLCSSYLEVATRYDRELLLLFPLFFGFSFRPFSFFSPPISLLLSRDAHDDGRRWTRRSSSSKSPHFFFYSVR